MSSLHAHVAWAGSSEASTCVARGMVHSVQRRPARMKVWLRPHGLDRTVPAGAAAWRRQHGLDRMA
eukprot:365119-Chlamydomonas_euryale.AAC.6